MGKVLIKKPGQPLSEVISFKSLQSRQTFQQLQKIVGGYIETVPVYGTDNIMMLVNEDRWNLPHNFDIIYGTAIFTSHDGTGEFAGLNDEQITKLRHELIRKEVRLGMDITFKGEDGQTKSGYVYGWNFGQRPNSLEVAIVENGQESLCDLVPFDSITELRVPIGPKLR